MKRLRVTNPTTMPIAITVLFEPLRDPPDVPFTLLVVLVSVARAVGFSVGKGGSWKFGGVPGVDELVGGGIGGGDDAIMELLEGRSGGGGIRC